MLCNLQDSTVQCSVAKNRFQDNFADTVALFCRCTGVSICQDTNLRGVLFQDVLWACLAGCQSCTCPAASFAFLVWPKRALTLAFSDVYLRYVVYHKSTQVCYHAPTLAPKLARPYQQSLPHDLRKT